MIAAWRPVLLAITIGVVLLVGLQQLAERVDIRIMMQASLSAFAFIPHGLQIPAGALPGRHAGVRSGSPGRWPPGQSPVTMAAAGTIYDYTLKDLGGVDVPLSNFSGKVVLIVNVASQDASAVEQYGGLRFLHQKFGSEGLEILAVPSNTFGQEPGVAIFNFTQEVGARFRTFLKVDVNGENEDELFKFLKKSTKSKNPPLTGNGIKDNFEKFLVDRQGKPVERFLAREPAARFQGKIQALIYGAARARGAPRAGAPGGALV
eukprot:CAMPEP_0179228160 /NCGR_PEP_ID=MMETSP0797-20121207/9685_1 /TAXON_ID=47934 /ORGANISM="Dinophysis acuminata, Strain DAEP01" /LENGTH=261 /DNA_ID=CAMNT_0020935209 /DNA_START=77 /DNA_END=863 /DNA_ORIENTATION=+